MLFHFQKCFVDDNIFPDCPSACGWVNNDWIFISEWTHALSISSWLYFCWRKILIARCATKSFQTIILVPFTVKDVNSSSTAACLYLSALIKHLTLIKVSAASELGWARWLKEEMTCITEWNSTKCCCLPFITGVVDFTLVPSILVVQFSIRQLIRIGAPFCCKREYRSENMCKC